MTQDSNSATYCAEVAILLETILDFFSNSFIPHAVHRATITPSREFHDSKSMTDTIMMMIIIIKHTMRRMLNQKTTTTKGKQRHKKKSSYSFVRDRLFDVHIAHSER